MTDNGLGSANSRSEHRRFRASLTLAIGLFGACTGICGFLFLKSDNRDRQNELPGSIDPNSATWIELVQLPEIGEASAKAIVEFREKHTRGGNLPTFKTPADLRQIKGIGPKTLRRITPYLIFKRPGDDVDKPEEPSR